MRIAIAEREGSWVRYFVYDDRGNELRQVARDCSAEIAKASRQHKALVEALAEAEGGKLAKAQGVRVIAPVPTAPVVSDHTHEEFAYPVKDHEHPLSEHSHAHSHPETEALSARLGRHEAEEISATGLELGHLQTQWQNANDTSVDWSWGTNFDPGAIAIEVKNATQAGATALKDIISMGILPFAR